MDVQKYLKSLGVSSVVGIIYWQSDEYNVNYKLYDSNNNSIKQKSHDNLPELWWLPKKQKEYESEITEWFISLIQDCSDEAYNIDLESLSVTKLDKSEYEIVYDDVFNVKYCKLTQKD